MTVQEGDLMLEVFGPGAEPPLPETTDGRVLRRERNRDAIVEALLELYQEGDPQPPARAVAERAGVSLRTVFQHFNDMDSLCAALAQRQVERVWMHLEPLPDPGEPLDVRVDALIKQRAQLFEAIAPTRRAAVLAAASSTTWLRGLARSEAFLRRQITEMFVDELAGDTDRIAAVDFAASWQAWDALRHSSGRSVSSASGITRSIVHALLTAQ